MLNRLSIATFCALLVGLFAVSSANAASPSDRAPLPPPTTYWQNKGFILMAHQGGEWDFPPNTMFAYKKAMALGADMIDMDAYVTNDKQLVLTHDLKASDNSNAPPGAGFNINDLTLAELKAYDFAYKWTPHGSPGATPPPFRGVATGAVPPPAGFTADDFKIPTFNEVLAAFPDTPINIELKQVAGVSIADTVKAMGDALAAHPGHDENVIINSFGQDMLAAMAEERPQHKSFSGSLSGSLAYIQGNPIEPRPVAIEPPDMFNLPPWVDTVPILKPWADHDGYKIFVWGSDHNPAQDTDPFYANLIAQGADSYNTPSPTTLAAYLCTAGVARPDGSPRCAQQICPEGQEGIAPNDCHDTACPPNMTGTPPNCVPVDPIIDPKASVKKVSFAKVKGKLKAGKSKKLTIKVAARNDGLSWNTKVKLKSSNRRVKVPGSVKLTVRPGKTVKKTITVRATRKAGKGKAKITATLGKIKASQLLFTAKTGKTGSASGR